MPSAADATVEYEGGQTPTAMSELTDSGDHKTYNSGADIWSGKSTFAPVVRPNGLITGGAVTIGVSGSNDMVDVAALSCYLAGIKTSVSAATDKALTRGATTDTHRINSITVSSAGAIVVIAGTASTAFSETRAAAGGPPLIPVGSIEIAQVRMNSITAAPILATEILAVPNVHTERYDYPIWLEKPESGAITFNTALPLIHTGGVAKKVYASYAEPVFTLVQNAGDFVPPEESFSTSSQQVYSGTIGSISKSLGAGSFTAYLKDGISDPLVGLKGEKIWFRFTPDKYAANYILCQGILGIGRTFPASGNIAAKCTIAPEKSAVDRIG